MTSSGTATASRGNGSDGEGDDADDDWTRRLVDGAQRESGIPPTGFADESEHGRDGDGDGVDDRIRRALAESARTDANLGALLRELHRVATTASAARGANVALSLELDGARTLCWESLAGERVLRERLRLAEQSAHAARLDSARTLAAFIAEEDAFLAELLSDHDRALAELSSDHEHDLAVLRSRLNSLEQALASDSPPDRITPVSDPPSTLASMRLRTVRIPLPSTGVASAVPRRVPNGDGPGNAGDPLATLPPPRPFVKPKLPPQTDLAARPLVEYSLRDGAVAAEHRGPKSHPPR